jgi:hypothetical protein
MVCSNIQGYYGCGSRNYASHCMAVSDCKYAMLES